MKSTLALCLVTPLCIFSDVGCSEQNDTPDGSGEPRPGVMPTGDTPEMVVPTEFIALRVGDGSAQLGATTAAPVFLERRKIADGQLVGSPMPVPTTASGSNHPLTLPGGGIAEGTLTASDDGRYVVFAGYDAALGARNFIDSAKRVIGRMAADGTIDTTTAFDASGSGNNIRSVVSNDGSHFWTSAVLGVSYTTLGSTAAPASLNNSNLRMLRIFDGQLFASRSSTTAGGINSIGTGLPTAAPAPPKQLNGFPAMGNMLSPYGFVAFDRDAMPGADTLYIADDRSGGAGGGVQRWVLSGGNWRLDGTMAVSNTAGARALDGYMFGTHVVLLATTSESTGAQTRIVTFTDTGEAAAGITPRVLVNAAAETAFRGLAIAPAP